LPEVKIRLSPLEKELTVARGTSLIDVLHEFGVEFPCGGKGICGKCKVKLLEGELALTPGHQSFLNDLGLSGEWRLACKSKADSDLVLEVGQYEAMIQADETPFSFEPRSGYGIAVDVGTTTLIAQLVDLSNAKVLAVETSLNPQRRWGSDLISRIESAIAANGHELTRLIREEIGSMLEKLIREKGISIERTILVGNTVMHHLFCGLDVRPLAFYPFKSPELNAKPFTAAELDWEIDCSQVLFYPSIGSFVGSDILAGIHATGMWRNQEPSVLVDLGTNGEIVLGNRERLLCASTAAGPAFEGARISSGMLATTGAISSVRAEGEDFLCSVIGNVNARGICGSGLIDAVAVMLDKGLLGEFGEILSGDPALRLTRDVDLTARDMQEFQLAKAAIASGLHMLMRKLKLAPEDIGRIYIAGAFGSYINLENMLRTGMMDFPREDIHNPREDIHKLGNSALIGAKMFLFSDLGIPEAILARTEHLQLESEPDFQDVFVSKLSFTPPSS
jgi:uncharacterized 2Fe-2S/4Fe-4S cluster protein (DUF4445 family)